jgi:hypothetical protein
MKSCSRFVFDQLQEELPVSATAVATTTAVESTATTTAVESTAATAAMEPAAAHVTVVAAATITRACITVTGSSIAITGPSVPIAAAIAVYTAVSTISVAPIPGAGPDKESAIEPRRSVVPVRRTSVGIITVVAVGASRSRVAIAITPVRRSTDPNSNRYLSMGIGRSGD